MAGIIRELQRRGVFRVCVAYLSVGWLLLQIFSVVAPYLGVGDWLGTALLVVLGLGFPVAAAVGWLYDLTPEGLRAAAAAPADALPDRVLSRKWDFVIIGVLAIALGLALSDRFLAPSGSAATTAAELPTPLPSIAVLPFVNLSSDPDQEYFSDGLADELLHALARLEGLQVAARTSSFLFKGTADDVHVIAAKLGVANVLEGSVRRSGQQLRISVQLIDAVTGYNRWSESYSRTLDDVFAIQEEIAAQVAGALSITLGVGERERLKSGTSSVAAYDHYLAAVSLLSEFGTDSTARGIEHLRQAVALDPSYADAWSYLAGAEVQQAFLGGVDFRARLALAEPTARQALTLDPRSEGGHAALGHVLYNLHRDWAGADREFRAAVANPSGYVSTWDYAEFLFAAGYLEEALENQRRTRQTLPLNVAPAVDLALAYHLLGDDSAAEAEFAEAADLIGEKDWIAYNRRWMTLGRADRGAVEALLMDSTQSLGVPYDEESRATLRALLARPARAADELRSLSAKVKGNVRREADVAIWAAYFDAPELAVELARPTVLINPSYLDRLWLPVMRAARRTPAFKDLVRELGVVELWRARGWPTRCRAAGTDDFECD